MTRSDGLERVDQCPWCGLETFEPCVDGVEDWFFGAVAGQFRYDRCAGCGSLVLRERPDAQHIASAYANYYTHEAPDSDVNPGMRQALRDRLSAAISDQLTGLPRQSALALAVRALIALSPGKASRMASWNRFLASGTLSVLDYGSGNGDFLRRAAQMGHQVAGVDFDADACAVAARSGFTVHHADGFDHADHLRAFDHVTANHVIEHVADPVALIAQFHAMLRDGGRLHVECPNAGAGGLAQYGKFWRGLEAPRHFTIPSRKALSDALAAAGFSDIQWFERSDVRADMDRQSARARQAHGGSIADIGSGRVQGSEFITVIAHRHG